MGQMTLQWGSQRHVFTVAELNAAIRGLLDREFPDIWVSGEISGTKQATSGHFYFSLKDKDAQLRCVCFRAAARYLRFKPQDGIAVLARGRIDVYEPRGEYQLLVEALEPQGYGALQLAFEQLKKNLAAEGLFEASRKRTLPRFPKRIGIVTSPKGAVMQDMLHVLERRFPGLHVRLYPALVQGEGSVDEVARGISYFSNSDWAEVVIVARGGGSLEDLWTFNEEEVARAIASCKVPVISAVGHETDVTIADFVADLRAPTPSAAAELVICTRQELFDQIAAADGRLLQATRFRLATAARELQQAGFDSTTSILQRQFGRRLQILDEFGNRLRERARHRIEARRRRLADLEARLRVRDLRVRLAVSHHRLETVSTAAARSVTLRLTTAESRLESLRTQLQHLSPLRVLERGYAIVESEAGRVIKEATSVPLDSSVRIRLSRGRLRAKVTESNPADS